MSKPEDLELDQADELEALEAEEGADEALAAEGEEEAAAASEDKAALRAEAMGELSGEETEEEAFDPLREKRREKLREMRLEARIEAIIFASQKPLKSFEILEILDDDELTLEHVEEACEQLVQFYEDRAGGFRLRNLKRLGYQFQTAAEAGPIMERMFASRPRPISRAALETLAIIAYRQPVTRAEVEFIRGVDAGSIFKTLLERDLIKCVGRKEVVGRPMLFGTTDEFLKVFNLSSLKDLPPLEAFQPNPEMVKGARERLEGEEEIDIEQYIADNTAGEPLTGADDEEGEEVSFDDAGEEDADELAAAAAEEGSEELAAAEADQDAERVEDLPREGATLATATDADYEEVVQALADEELEEESERSLTGATVQSHPEALGQEDDFDGEGLDLARSGATGKPEAEFN